MGSMGYIKAFITLKECHNFDGYIKDGTTKVLEGGFNSANVISVEADGPSKTDILLQESAFGGQVGTTGARRKVRVNLPVEKVNALFEYLEIEGGVLDLLAHTRPDKPASTETPVPHRGLHGQILSIDFNNMAEPGVRTKRPLGPPASKLPDSKPFRPFGKI